MDADADFHFVVAQLKGGLAGRRHGAGSQGHAHAAAVAVGLAGQIGALVEVVTGFGCRAHDFLDQHGGADAATPGRVETVFHGYVVIDEDVLDRNAVRVGQLGRGLEIEHVAGVILDQEQDACAAVDGLGGFIHLIRRGRGEDFAGAGGIEHAHAHKAAVHRFVAAAAAGYDGHFAGHRRVGTIDIVRFEVDFQQVGMRGSHAL